MAEKDSDLSVKVDLIDIYKTYQMGEVSVSVLKGINTKIYSAQLTTILGASGSGKSTLINLIGGIDRPTRGKIIFDNKDITSFSDQQLTEFRRLNVGFVFQFYNLVASLTAKENVEVSTSIVTDPMDPVEALKQVGLEDYMNHFPAELSGGQQQRVAIARALAKKPQLMLCDEPTGALDHDTSIIILNLLQNLNKTLGTTIVMITHAPPIATLANRVIKIGGGIVRETHINPQPRTAREIQW